MSYDKLYRQRERAEQVRERYAEKVAAIRDNQDLSDDGRQRQLAALHATAKSELAKYGAAERELLATRRSELERELFGARKSLLQDSGSFAISARDAADRASQIKTPAEAQRLLLDAEANGDDVLARAVARVASERFNSGVRQRDEEWEGVVRDYLSARPHLQATVDELGEIETMSQPMVFSPYGISTPREVPTQYVNAAKPCAKVVPPRRTVGPLRDPATMDTTHQQRADWDAAVSYGS